MVQKNFENSTRSSATEVVLALSAEMPATLRKIEETKTMLMPALVQMLTEVEEDMDVWTSSNDDKDTGANDPYNTAIAAINRLSSDLKGNTILSICTPLIKTLASN